mgnify:CR=1 FL=1
MNGLKILVVDDEARMRKLVKDFLANKGFYVEEAGDGEEAVDKFFAQKDIALVLLDVMMPKMDGIHVLEKLRRQGNALPVLLLTARDSIEDRVRGLDAGADDYLVKPFSFDELLARIRAMTRKSTGSVTNVFTCGDLSLDAASHRVTRAGKSIDLSAKEFAVLEFMIRNKGSVLSREAIENNVWSYDWEGGTNVVDVYMSYLRRKLDADFDKKLIHTVRGVGWVLRDEA